MPTARNGRSISSYLTLPFAWIGTFLGRLFRPTARGKLRWSVFAVLLAAALAGFLASPGTWNRAADWANARAEQLKLPSGLRVPHVRDVPFRLGLDLQGGTHLVYEADTQGITESERAAAMEGVRDVIERRVNAFGVAEPIVQTNRAGDSWRIIAELAGVSDVKEAIRMIGETPILEFKEANDVTDVPLTDAQKAELEKKQADAKKKAQEALNKVLSGGPSVDFAAIAKEYSEDPAAAQSGGGLGLVQRETYPDLWAWADTHRTTRISRVLVEGEGGWNVVRLNRRDDSAKEVQASHILICYKDATGCGEDLTKEQALGQIQELRTALTPENFSERAKANSTDPSAASNGGDLGWFGPGEMVKPFEDALQTLKKGEISQPVETEFGWHLIYKQDERPFVRYDMDRIFVRQPTAADVAPPVDPWKNTGLSGKHVRRAQLEFDPTTNIPQVALQFNDEGRQLFAEITERNVGSPVAIYLDGEAISIPRVQTAITDGNAVISGDFDVKEAKLLAQRLNAGALPVPITLLSQQTVGASLGQDSLAKSLRAGLVGFLIVAAFMILFYRLPGLLAALALAMYTAFSLAVFKLWGLTLTLSGIAGVILSIGMAVDANILIFERMREELKNGRPLDSAVNEGFKRAWTSIRDSNVASLITCAILYSFTSSSVRGFAVTLALGILISMFSAIIVTRSLLRLVTPWFAKHSWLFR